MAILLSRDYSVYVGKDDYLEQDLSNKLSRQFGLRQSLPIPFSQSLNQPWHSRSVKGLDQLERADIPSELPSG